MLDGLNECPLMHWDRAISDIKQFLNTYTKVNFIMSCRSRDCPDIFQLPVLLLKPMDQRTVNRFIVHSFHSDPDREKKVENFKAMLSGNYADIIRNPLLLNIAVNVYRDMGGILPNNPGILSRNFFDNWIRRENLKKKKNLSTARTLIMLELAGWIGNFLQNRGEVRTSREAVWGVIRAFLQRYIERITIQKELYSSDILLDELLGMGLLLETTGRVKFYHQLFQEFFSGYCLLHQSPEDAVRRLGYSWWDESLRIFAGLTEDATFLVHEALQKSNVFTAARLVQSCETCDNEQRLALYRKLLYMLFDKFSLNRERAQDLLATDSDSKIDFLLQKLIESDPEENHENVYRLISKKRGSLQVQKRKTDSYGLSDKVIQSGISEKYPAYAKSLAQVLKNVAQRVDINNVSDRAVELREVSSVFGSQEVEKVLVSYKNAASDSNRPLFVSWCFSIIRERDIFGCLFELYSNEQIFRLYPDVETWDDSCEKHIRVLINSIFNRDVDQVWLNELLYIRLIQAIDINFAKLYAEVLRSKLNDSRFSYEKMRFAVQQLRDYDREYAEETILSWLDRESDNRHTVTLLQFLATYGLLDRNIHTGIELFERMKKEYKIYFPELLARSGAVSALHFLMNIVQDESHDLILRSISLNAMEWVAGENEIEFLQELVQSDKKELYDTAYYVLESVRERKRYDAKIFAEETAGDMALDILMDDAKPVQSSRQVRVSVFEDDQKIVLINGIQVKLGAVSGKLFYFLAKNTTLGSYRSADEICEYLRRQDLYLEKSAVRNRIADIRKKIVKTLEGRIDAHYFLENARRFGYKINAKID